MIIREHNISKSLINSLFNIHNIPLQNKFFPADIEEIIFIINKINSIKINGYIHQIHNFYNPDDDLNTISSLHDEFKTNSIYHQILSEESEDE